MWHRRSQRARKGKRSRPFWKIKLRFPDGKPTQIWEETRDEEFPREMDGEAFILGTYP